MIRSYSYKDFTYTLDNQDRIKIIHPKKEEKSLFKYYPASMYSIKALMEHYLYASHPIQFNDIMDCSMYLMDLNNITKEKYDKFYDGFAKNDFPVKPYDNDKEQNFDCFRTYFYIWHLSHLGVISLTDNSLHPLMWAHYAHETGFAIQFNTLELKKSLNDLNNDIKYWDLHPVQYCEELKPVRVLSRNNELEPVCLAYISNVKLKDWTYEHEWRLLVQKENMGYMSGDAVPNKFDIPGKQDRCCYYSPSAIEAIYLGAHFFGSTYFAPDPSLYKVKEIYIPFINYLFENHNEHLFICCAFNNSQHQLVRGYYQIKLQRIRRGLFDYQYVDKNIYYINERNTLVKKTKL